MSPSEYIRFYIYILEKLIFWRIFSASELHILSCLFWVIYISFHAWNRQLGWIFLLFSHLEKHKRGGMQLQWSTSFFLCHRWEKIRWTERQRRIICKNSDFRTLMLPIFVMLGTVLAFFIYIFLFQPCIRQNSLTPPQPTFFFPKYIYIHTFYPLFNFNPYLCTKINIVYIYEMSGKQKKKKKSEYILTLIRV